MYRNRGGELKLTGYKVMKALTGAQAMNLTGTHAVNAMTGNQ